MNSQNGGTFSDVDEPGIQGHYCVLFFFFSTRSVKSRRGNVKNAHSLQTPTVRTTCTQTGRGRMRKVSPRLCTSTAATRDCDDGVIEPRQYNIYDDRSRFGREQFYNRTDAVLRIKCSIIIIITFLRCILYYIIYCIRAHCMRRLRSARCN